MLTLPGAPVVYYGDELGLAGKNDPDSRRVMPAESALMPSQVETRNVVRKLGRVRACSDALRRGALRTLVADAERFVFAREIVGDVAGAVVVALSRRPSLTADVKLPPDLIPRVTVDQLAKYGQSEVVQVVIPLRTITPESIVSSLQKLKISSLQASTHVSD